MAKKFASIIVLCSLLATTLTVHGSAFDVVSTSDDISLYEEIIVFSQDENMLYNSNVSPMSGKTDFEIAQENILKLHLPERGLAYIESACLTQIETYENIPNCQLNEYIVLVPKNLSMSTPTYLTTYKGTEFYTSVTSKSNITIKKIKFAFSNILDNWFSGLVNLAFCFGGSVEFTVPWALITSFLPSESYTVYKSDWIDSYININPTQRTLFVKDGNNYEAVYYNEFGPTHPYLVYHYNDATINDPAAIINLEKRSYPDIIKHGTCDEKVLDIGRDIYLYGAMPLRLTIANAVGFQWLE